MTRLPVLPDRRDASGRRRAIVEARNGPSARALLDDAVAALDEAVAATGSGNVDPRALWRALERAYDSIDRYLAEIVERAELGIRCGPSCSACCSDAPPTFAVEGLRLARALRRRKDGPARMQRAVEYARQFQKLLLETAAEHGTERTDAMNTSSETYRRAQLHWRTLGNPCPVLADDGNCAAYSDRPLACRTHISILDPVRCAPDHPEFLTQERPAIWGDPREAELERKLIALGRALELPPTPNLPWAIAALHDHPLAKP